MEHPWKEIQLKDYETHMSLENVRQLPTLNHMMLGQLYDYPVSTAMIFGIAGGNGLNHVKPGCFKKVYGIDINQEYLTVCQTRYPLLKDIFVPIACDLTGDVTMLPHADLLIANLLIEYVGYHALKKGILAVRPDYVSCIIQVNSGGSFVSNSPYVHKFDRLQEVHHKVTQQGLSQAMDEIAYGSMLMKEEALPNGKKLVRLDFKNYKKQRGAKS